MRIIGFEFSPRLRRGGRLARRQAQTAGRVDMRRHFLEASAKKLTREDVGVVETIGNAASACGGDCAARQEGCDRKSQAGSHHRL
jgi:hypothetical protein